MTTWVVRTAWAGRGSPRVDGHAPFGGRASGDVRAAEVGELRGEKPVEPEAVLLRNHDEAVFGGGHLPLSPAGAIRRRRQRSNAAVRPAAMATTCDVEMLRISPRGIAARHLDGKPEETRTGGRTRERHAPHGACAGRGRSGRRRAENRALIRRAGKDGSRRPGGPRSNRCASSLLKVTPQGARSDGRSSNRRRSSRAFPPPDQARSKEPRRPRPSIPEGPRRTTRMRQVTTDAMNRRRKPPPIESAQDAREGCRGS